MVIAEYIFLKDFVEAESKTKEEFINKAFDAFVNSGYSVNREDMFAIIYLEKEHFVKELNKAMMSYIELSKYLLNRLSRISNEIYFFSPKFRKLHKENIDLCNMAIQIIDKLKKPSIHFDLFLKNESSNVVAVTKFVKELNEYFFKIVGNKNRTVAWKEKMNEFSELLNKFVCAVNKQEYKKQDNQPFYQSYAMLNNDIKKSGEF